MSRIGFIGLGVMGDQMAARLACAGHDVCGFRRAAVADCAMVRGGGHLGRSVAEAVEGAEYVFTMLPDGVAVETVWCGQGGVIEHAQAGSICVDMSTVEPEIARKLHSEGASKGLPVLDAPVSGGEEGAIAGTLAIMVGGAESVLNRTERLFTVLGDKVVHVGGPGCGQAVKAANQLLVAGNMQILAEAVTMLNAAGVDERAALDVIGSGLAGSRVLDAKAVRMQKEEFSPGFRERLQLKDVLIAVAMCRELGVVVPLGGLLAQLLAAACRSGLGEYDHSVAVELVRRLSGRQTGLTCREAVPGDRSSG